MDDLRQAPTTTATNPFLSGNFAPVDAETTSFDLEVHGKIPEVLDGRFLRIGPNPIGPVDPLRFHWFLGSGMAHGLRLRARRDVWYRSRFVLSAKATEALGRVLIPARAPVVVMARSIPTSPPRPASSTRWSRPERRSALRAIRLLCRAMQSMREGLAAVSSGPDLAG
jgi:carotenoid cleavage dioxygenase-like enzyme